jgi:hypothetical protein
VNEKLRVLRPLATDGARLAHHVLRFMNHGAMASAMKERARVEDAPELRVLTESRRALTWSYVVLFNWALRHR